MSNAPAEKSVLVVSDSATETTLIRSMLEEEFAHVQESAEVDSAPKLFLKLQAAVLVLAFRDLRKAELFYLGLYRQGTEQKFHVHPHRAIILCGKEDVRKAYELCRSGLVDDYVQFWPMTFDPSRLGMSVHRCLQECVVQTGATFSTAAFAVQARRLAQLEELLAQSLHAGAALTAASGEAVVKAEAGIGQALDGLAAHMLDGGSMTLGSGSSAEDVTREVAHYSADSVLPHLRDVSSAVEPLNAWMGDLGTALDPHIKSAQALLDMASQVRSCVLIVDDDAFQRQISGQIFEADGYLVKYAGNGGEALSMLTKMRPDLILMDVQMPDMTGLQVIERIKSNLSLADVPVIMVTGKADRDVVLGSVRLGAADFIVKPVERQTLLAKAARLLAPDAANKQAQRPQLSAGAV